MSNIQFDVTVVFGKVMASGEHSYPDNSAISGFKKNYGDLIVEAGFAKNSKNWMKETHGICHSEQISSAVINALFKINSKK